jgi:membrane-associated phospholipid phosphatase
MAENARLFALLNFGMADAQISCWDTKYTYNFVRPVTAIRNAANDGNPDTEADTAWAPLITTPAHPSYTSGHSTVSAAAATVLGNLFGDNSIAFEDTAELSAGGATVTRSFDGFWEAAEEAASSRLYAGIHWSFDNDAGLKAGRGVGAYVADNLMRPRAAGRAADPEAPVFPPALSAVHGVDRANWAGSHGSEDGILSGSAGLPDGLLA